MKSSISPFIILTVIVAIVWFSSIAVIYFAFPDWQLRGSFGDAFGSVNSLFSGLALAGVVYALILQRKELQMQREELQMNRDVMQGQLDEMKTSRQIQSQPLVIPSKCLFSIERPRFYYTPPEDKYSTMSRYHAKFSVSNPTEYPAVIVNCRAYLVLKNDADKLDALGAVDEFIDVVVPQLASESNLNEVSFMYIGDEEGKLFNALRQSDPRKVPVLYTNIYYKNVIGAHFKVTQIFHVFPKDENLSVLRKWHSCIASFQANFKSHLNELGKLKNKNEIEWDNVFQGVKEEFDGQLDSEDKNLLFSASEMPGEFNVKQLSAAEYQKELGPVSYAQRMTDNFDCPSEIDAAKE